MLDNDFKESLDSISKDYSLYSKEKDKQSLFYLEQMIDLLYGELSYVVYNKIILHDLVYNELKKNLMLITNDLFEYSSKISKELKAPFEQLIKMSATNKYIDLNNLTNLYNKFSKEAEAKYNIQNKVSALINANINSFYAKLTTKVIINNKDVVNTTLIKYRDTFIIELIKNITGKKENFLCFYKRFIDEILKEIYERKDEIRLKNTNMVINTAYLYLKEAEYININKYIDNNVKLINETLDLLIKDLRNAKALKENVLEPIKIRDYFLGFNNTISIKITNVFDEMNLIVTLDKDEINTKIKQFNDLITHIFEMDLVFDKQFDDYKKSLSSKIKNLNKFDEIVNAKNRALSDGIRANIFNIFRENIKIYNDIVYRTMLFKTNIDNYNIILDKDKIKDLLLK
ncbi:MAG: hypothetical protein Q4C29_03075 [bacterium]|nr:hypothetical protein [bacterium]